MTPEAMARFIERCINGELTEDDEIDWDYINVKSRVGTNLVVEYKKRDSLTAQRYIVHVKKG